MQGEAARTGLAHHLAEGPGTKIGTYVGAVLMGTKLRMWLPTGGGEDAKVVVEVLGLREEFLERWVGLVGERILALGVGSGGGLKWSR